MVWLLTGFGNYVLYRDWKAPASGSVAGLLWAGLALLIAAALALGFLRARGQARGTVYTLVFWTLIALVPSQILTFLHPVTDRYLFFPSVAFTILVGWGLATVASRSRPRIRLLVIAAAAALGLIWGMKTIRYLDEWNDPRSVWFAAASRSREPEVIGNLGGHYQDVADQLAGREERGRVAALAMAPLVWDGDPRLRLLHDQLTRSEWGGSATHAFVDTLRSEAERDIDAALAIPTSRLQPLLQFRRGKLAMDRGDLAGARQHAEAALAAAQSFTSAELRTEMMARTHQALAVIAWKEADWEACVSHFRAVDEIQRQAGHVWLPNVPDWIAKAEAQRAGAPARP
jgi:hypothetical protein